MRTWIYLFSQVRSVPAGINLSELPIETLKQGKKYVQI